VDAAPPVMLIQGQKVDSKEEYWVSQSLEKYGWEYAYQVPINGGSEISGGFKIDFVVITVPLFTPLEIQSDYWHPGARSDRDRLKELFIATQMKNYFPLKELWGNVLTDPDATDQAVLHMFGRR